MSENVAIPKIIKEHRYGKLLGRIWLETHVYDGIVTIVFCGKRGNGKSLSMMELARIIDRDKEGNPRFKPEDVKLDPVEFFKSLTGEYPPGKVLCLDDAGLHMYKSDALSDFLKRISKILQNIRYKHPIIMMSLPHFGQLVKDARDMTDIYVEMRGVNRRRNLAYGTIQSITSSPVTGDLYRYTILQSVDNENPKFKMAIRHWVPKPYFFDKPNKEFVKAYQKIKKPTLDRINAQHLKAIKEQYLDDGSSKRSSMNLRDGLEYCKQKVETLKGKNGDIEVGKIMLQSDAEGNPLFGYSRAIILARMLR